MSWSNLPDNTLAINNKSSNGHAQYALEHASLPNVYLLRSNCDGKLGKTNTVEKKINFEIISLKNKNIYFI